SAAPADDSGAVDRVLPGQHGPPEPTAATTSEEVAATSPVEAASPPGFGNADVVAMTKAGFTEGTILAAMGANPTRFDVRPSELVALKNEGVSERVIEAMLTT